MVRAFLLGQMAVIAAVVATLLYFPLGLLLALVLALLDIPLHPIVTFGGAFGVLGGLLAWWLVLYVPALVYAAIAFPWTETQGFSGIHSGGASRACQAKR